MKKSFYLFGIAGVFLGLALFARAASIFDITYPIAELGGCASREECKVYCDDLANKDACLSFAEKFGFVAKEKVAEAKKLPALGPGGCKSAEECRAYCDNPDNEESCLAFAEKYGMKTEGLRGQEVAERARLIKEQGGPGNCQSQKECRAYCENPSNHKECLDFAEKHNLIDKKELKAARKVMESGGPGGCRSKEACEAYCENPDNMMECVKFAEEHDLIDPKEAEMVKRMPPVGPGGCRGKECKTYCDNPDHAEECLAFAEKNGLMPKEELERAKKLAGKPGPGGCLGRACEEFCRKSENRDACFQFSVDNNMISREEIEHAKKMKDMMAQGGPGGCQGPEECRAYCESPDHSDECIEFAKKNNLVGEKEIKMMERGREMMKKAREAGGPGGCQGPEECRAYCEKPDNVERCLAFAVEQGGMDVGEAKDMLENFAQAGLPQQVGGPGGQGDDFRRMGNPPRGMMPPPIGGFATSSGEHFKRFEQFRELESQFRKPPEMMQNFQGPGGCHSPEECIKYCSNPEHRAECAKVNPSVGASPPGEIFRQIAPGTERDFRRDSATTTPFGGLKEGAPPINIEGSACPREYHPVCGANNRTYPNECFAKKDNASIVKEGPCGGNSENEFRPEGAMSPEVFRNPPEGFESMQGKMMPPPDGFKPEGAPQTQTQPPFYPFSDQFRQYQPQQPPQYVPQYTQPPVIQEQPAAPPQSRRITSSLFSSLLQAFSNALRMR